MYGTNKEAGFTMIELVIIMLIISVLSCALIPFSLEAVNRSQLESAAEMIAGDIRYVENKALSQQTDLFKIQFIPSNNQYRLFFDPANPAQYETKELPERVTMYNAVFGTEGSKVYFNARGTATQGGMISLHDKSNNWLFVKVTPVTGRVKVDEKSD